MMKKITSLLLIGFITFITSVILFNSSVHAWSTVNFSSCQDLLKQPGDKAHHPSGTFGIAGAGMQEGQDDVYSMSNGNFIQCFCPKNGTIGIQTNWQKTDVAPANSWTEENGRDWGLDTATYFAHNSNFSCGSSQPTPSCSPTPSLAPTETPVPTEEVTPTPTAAPSGDTGGNGGGSSPQPEGNASTTNAPGAAVCTISFDAPKLQGFSIDGNGAMTFSWWKSTASNLTKQSIRYGYSKDNLAFGVDNLPTDLTSFTIQDLQPGKHVWAIVTAWQGGCAQDSNELDPVVR